jgi:hypothetical protein
MATADQVLDLSRSQLGQGPDKFWQWYPSGPVAWCCIYQSWVLSNSGLPTHFAWVSGLFDAMRADGRCSYDIRSATPGSLIAFEWDGTGQGSYDHIAMVESVDANGVTAINGNWSGKVTRAWHSFTSGGIAEVAFPAYDITPTPSPQEDNVKDALIRDPRDGAVYRITQPGNLAVHLDADAYASAVQAGIPMIGDVDPGVLGNFGLVPSINESKK